MPNYAALTSHLENVPPERTQTQMTFAEIEAIIGEELPFSASHYRAWWSNSPSNSKLTVAWLEAGWKSAKVDMQGRKLMFVRQPRELFGEALSAPQPSSPNDRQCSTVLISGLSAKAMNDMERRARLANTSVEHIARELLETHAALSVDDMLAIADRHRARSPAISDVDVPALLREDRDRP